jgi:hypothetical protein
MASMECCLIGGAPCGNPHRVPSFGRTSSAAVGLDRAFQVGYASIEHLAGYGQYLTNGALEHWGRLHWPSQLAVDGRAGE